MGIYLTPHCDRAIQPLTTISRLARTALISQIVYMDWHCVLENQPENADH